MENTKQLLIRRRISFLTISFIILLTISIIDIVLSKITAGSLHIGLTLVMAFALLKVIGKD
jgi:hypothetical protein